MSLPGKGNRLRRTVLRTGDGDVGEAGGPYDKAVAKRLSDHVFSVGNTIDASDTYRAFRGRDANIDALLRRRGFPVTAPSTKKKTVAP